MSTIGAAGAGSSAAGSFAETTVKTLLQLEEENALNMANEKHIAASEAFSSAFNTFEKYIKVIGIVAIIGLGVIALGVCCRFNVGALPDVLSKQYAWIPLVVGGVALTTLPFSLNVANCKYKNSQNVKARHAYNALYHKKLGISYVRF